MSKLFPISLLAHFFLEHQSPLLPQGLKIVLVEVLECCQLSINSLLLLCCSLQQATLHVCHRGINHLVVHGHIAVVEFVVEIGVIVFFRMLKDATTH